MGEGEAFYIRFAWKEDTYTEIGYNRKEGELYLDRSRAEDIINPVPLAKAKIKEKNGKIKLRIILDIYSAEVFVNDGSEVISAAFYTPLNASEIGFRAEGRVPLHIQSYTL